MKYAPAIALGFAAVLMSAIAYGQDEGAIPKEALDDLGYYVGDWTTSVEYGDKVTEGTWSAKWSAEGKCLVLSISETTKNDKGEQVKTYATGLMGWDLPTESLKEVSFWSNGDTYDARYKKISDTEWKGNAKGTVDGKEYTEKVSFTRDGPRKFVWKAFEYVLGGKKQHDLVATIEKKVRRDTESHDKLSEAFGWLIGDWEVDGNQNPFGDFHMAFSFGWDVDGTVVSYRATVKTANANWLSDRRIYWDSIDEKIKIVNFLGGLGSGIPGVVKECGDKRVALVNTRTKKDGSKGQWEVHLSLQDDGTLLYQYFSILDDGTKKENWRFELTKK